MNAVGADRSTSFVKPSKCAPEWSRGQRPLECLLEQSPWRVSPTGGPVDMDNLAEPVEVKRAGILQGHLGAPHRMLVGLAADALDIDGMVVQGHDAARQEDGDTAVAKAER